MQQSESIPAPTRPMPQSAQAAAMVTGRAAPEEGDGPATRSGRNGDPQRNAPDVPSLTSVARLRALLKQMESDLGLADLSEHERDVLYAAWIASRPTDGGERAFSSDELRSGEIAEEIAPATFYRALKALRERGFMHFAQGRRRNHYTIAWTADRWRGRRRG